MEGIARTLTLNVEEYRELVEDRASYQNEVYNLRKRVEELEARNEELREYRDGAHERIKILLEIASFAVSVALGNKEIDDEFDVDIDERVGITNLGIDEDE